MSISQVNHETKSASASQVSIFSNPRPRKQSTRHSIYHRFFGSSSNVSLPGGQDSVDEYRQHFHARLGEYAAKLWRDKNLTDVLIVVQAQEFKAHKAVLACYSPYFKEVLLKPGANVVHYLEIPSVTARAFEILLSYMYIGEMQLTCQDLADVYRAARRLGMKDALNKCLELLSVSPSHIENTIHLYVTSMKLNLHEPASKAFKLMTTHFETIVQAPEFLDLNEEQVLDFLSADEIGARSELVVYIAALSWINHKFLEREHCITHVTQAIRFPLMSLEEVVHCFHPPVLPGIVQYPVVREGIMNGTIYVAAKSYGQEEIFREFSCRQRNYLLADEPIILWNCEGLYNPYYYKGYRDSIAATKIQATFRGYTARKQVEDVIYKRERAATIIQATFRSFSEKKKFRKLVEKHRQKIKEQLTVEQGRIGWHTLVPDVKVTSIGEHEYGVEVKSTIYIVGGIDATKAEPVSNCILSYDPLSRAEWKEIAHMPEPRHDIKAIFLNNELYCIGGCVPRDSDSKILVPKADCFRYNVTSETWIPMSSMETPRTFHGLATLNQLIYAIGGKDHHAQILSSVECYNPTTNTWTEIKDMSVPRMGMGTAGFAEKIWVAGGLTSQEKKMTLVNDVEVFEPGNFRWQKRTNLPHATAFTSLVATTERLFLVGGAVQKSHDCQEMLSKDEIYEFDMRDSYWKKFASLPMPLHTAIAIGLDEKIYVLGGFCSQQSSILKEVFYLDCKTKQWCPSCYIPMETVGYIVSAWGSENSTGQSISN